MRDTLLAGAVLISLLVSPFARAAGPAIPTSKRAVDVVLLKDNTLLLGLLWSAHPGQDVEFIVRTEWLQQNAAAYFAQAMPRQKANQRAALEQLHRRISEWLAKREKDSENLAFFLKTEQSRVEQELEDLDDAGEANGAREPDLTMLEIPTAQIRRQTKQSVDVRKVLGWAWDQRLDDPENRTASDLRDELKADGIDVKEEPTELWKRLAPRRQSDRQWATRVALVEFMYFRKPDFQGTDAFLMRADEAGAKVPIGELLQGQLEGQLKELLGEANGATKGPAPEEAAKREAAQADHRGFRVTQMLQAGGGRPGTIRGRFFAQMPDGTWLNVWQEEFTPNGNNPNAQNEQRIANDPRVKQALDLAAALGIKPDSDQMRLALQAGAATMEGQQEVNKKFDEVLSRYSQRLDGPDIPASVTDPAPAKRKN